MANVTLWQFITFGAWFWIVCDPVATVTPKSPFLTLAAYFNTQNFRKINRTIPLRFFTKRLKNLKILYKKQFFFTEIIIFALFSVKFEQTIAT